LLHPPLESLRSRVRFFFSLQLGRKNPFQVVSAEPPTTLVVLPWQLCLAMSILGFLLHELRDLCFPPLFFFCGGVRFYDFHPNPRRSISNSPVFPLTAPRSVFGRPPPPANLFELLLYRCGPIVDRPKGPAWFANVILLA